jgi:hypothetical protein
MRVLALSLLLQGNASPRYMLLPATDSKSADLATPPYL